MKTLKELDIQNKRVIVRVDFNVPMENGIITDENKIIKSIPTIKYLLDNNCKVILLSHLGRVKSEEDKYKNSLKEVGVALANHLQKEVKFINNCYGEKVKQLVDESTNGEVILLENTRFMDYPEKLESSNNETLAKYWASLADVFINDAFGSSHRLHASTAGIAKFIPSGIGFLIEKELAGLKPLVTDTPHPFGVIMGGAKVDDKLALIKSLLPKCDYLLLGGGIANSFLKAKGVDIGESLATSDSTILAELITLMNTYQEKIILPVDFVNAKNINDIGPETLKLYQEYINKCAIIFMNGTVGKYEEEEYATGTKELLNILKTSGKPVIIGGGDTASSVKKFGYEDSFQFISTGGGATLEYIAEGKLIALE